MSVCRQILFILTHFPLRHFPNWCRSGATPAFAWTAPLPSLSPLKRLSTSADVWASFHKHWFHKVWFQVLSDLLQYNRRLCSLESTSLVANPPRMLSPSLSFSYCLFLMRMAVPSCQSVSVSFPAPVTHNLICVCDCLLLISFQETNSTRMSVWTAHVSCVSEQRYLPLLLFRCALSAAPFVSREGHHHHSVCHPSTQDSVLCVGLLYVHIQAMAKVFKSLSEQNLPGVYSFPSYTEFRSSGTCRLRI